MKKEPVTAAVALRRLRDGNSRFVAADRCIDTYLSHTRLDEHLEGQAPYAVILGCSDSRVPVEIIFDAGIGDLFVIRVAGNIVSPALIGSVELAADLFGSRLVVVLGHSGCGAVQYTLQDIENPGSVGAGHTNSIVDSIRPSVERVLADHAGEEPASIVALSVRENVRAAADTLRSGSETLSQLSQDDGLVVVGAEYSLETGAVEFFDGVPD